MTCHTIMMGHFEHGIIEIHRHTDPSGSQIHLIPDVGRARIEEIESVASLDNLEILGEGLQNRGLEVMLLGVARSALEEHGTSRLERITANLEAALHFREAFGPERVKVERFNAQTMEFEEANIGLDGLIVFLQSSPLRFAPVTQHPFRLIAELT